MKYYCMLPVLCLLSASLRAADEPSLKELQHAANQVLFADQSYREERGALRREQKRAGCCWNPKAQKIIWSAAQVIGPLFFIAHTTLRVYKYNNDCEF